jgi:hypothetical protein
VFINSAVWRSYRRLSLNQHGMSEISTCIKVGRVRGKTTMRTTERTFGTRTQLSTLVTELGSVVRFNSNNFDSFSFSFILDKILQLEETPIANPIVHSSSSVYLPDAFQVFHYNLVSIKVGNNLLTDVVVNPSHITSFSSRELLEKSLSGTSAFGLQFTAKMLESPFGLLDLRRIEESAVRSDGEIVYSEVNAENTVMQTIATDINLFGKHKEKETSAFSVNPQQTFLDIPSIKILPITFWDTKDKLFSLVKSSDGENIPIQPCTTGEVIANRGSFDEGLVFSLLDHPTGLFNASDSQLGRQFEFSLDIFIDNMVEFDVIPNLVFPSGINAELQGFGVSLESIDYFWSCFNLDFNCRNGLHKLNIGQGIYKYFGFSRRTSNLNHSAKPKAIREVPLNEKPQLTSNHYQMGDCYGKKSISTLQSNEEQFRCQNSDSADRKSLQVQHQLPHYLDTEVSQTHIAG